MNKTLFLAQLQDALRWKLKPQEVSDIIADYEGFFNSDDGKSEAEICADLGDVRAIAADIIAEAARRPAREVKNYSALKWKLLLIALGFFIPGYFVFLAPTYGNLLGNLFTTALVSLLVFIGVFALILTKGANIPSERFQKSGRQKYIPIIICHIIFIVAIVINFVTYDNWLVSMVNEPTQYGDSVFGNWDLYTRLGSIFLLILSLVGFYRSSPYYFTVSVHAIGVLAFHIAQLYTLRNLMGGDLSLVRGQHLLAFVVYAVAVIASLALAFYIRRLKRRA
ncbi:MAG: DUF1700 domain-containing protein [Oscillospiraceae bacterium]|jgi:uncharacterized membrane protein|nr:DUF1700 domain-containing protein [Oscillospiraceae bacterium]